MAATDPLPNWFDVDKIFARGNGWFFGSRTGLHVGPYDNRGIARAKGEKVGKRLRSLKTPDDQLRFVRGFLHKEWQEFGATGSFAPESDSPTTGQAYAVRSGEKHKNWYRAGRFFHVDGVWFFSTREGIDVGPFISEAEAHRHERRLVGLLVRAKTEEEACRVIYEYKHRPSAGPMKPKSAPRRGRH